MVHEKQAYKPRTIFETPKRLEEAAAASRVWQPELKQDTKIQSNIAVAPSSEASPHDKPEELVPVLVVEVLAAKPDDIQSEPIGTEASVDSLKATANLGSNGVRNDFSVCRRC